MPPTGNAAAIADFVIDARERRFPPDVIDAAKRCLIDWCGVTLGGAAQPAARAVGQVVERWATQGRALAFSGRKMAPTGAAMINGTMAHCLDYDDTHVGSVTHIGGPTIAAALARAHHVGAGERELLAAVIAGFETAARLGRGAGQPANMRGLHATGIFGAFGAAAAASVLTDLDQAGVRNALGAAATQTGGLTASFGTMSKPFHAGKAAFNGLLSLDLAIAGFVAKDDLLEPGGGLEGAVFQDGAIRLSVVDFADGWEITQNTFKPYAACLLTHALIDGARRLAAETRGREIEKVAAWAGAPAIKLAGIAEPQTPLEGKFSLAYCAALGLTGHAASEADFTPERLADPNLRQIMRRVELNQDPGMADTATRLEAAFADGGALVVDVPLALGNPGNPMSQQDMWRKFEPLVRPTLGPATEELFDLLDDFERHGAMDRLTDLVANRA